MDFNIFVVLLWCAVFAETQGSERYEITYPERLHVHRAKRDLSTFTKNGHENDASFSVKAFKKTLILDAKRNDQLIPKDFVSRYYDSDDTAIISREAPNPCHYQGSVRGIPGSVVALETCNGLSGVIDDGTDTYNIEPHADFQKTGAHKIYTSSDQESFDSHEHCGTKHTEEQFDESRNKKSTLSKTIERLRRGLGHVVNVEEVYKKYLTTSETRYNEVLFVVDQGIYSRYDNDDKEVTRKVAILCNAVDAIYQRINIRVVFTAIEIWSNGDRMKRTKSSAGTELSTFKKYRQAHLTNIHHDNAQFLSHHAWPGIAGMAYVGTMCGSASASINVWSFGGITGPLVVVAHEMGHNFKFSHNTGDCKCLTPRGCFMGGHKTRVPGFSDCNLNSLKKLNDKCLYNVPVQALNARCGNGIKEGDEECDCGTPEMCKAKDPCCLPHDCKLRPSAVCSDLHHSCCKSCQFKRQGSLCRKLKSDCDVPEYCTGESRDCPSDAVLQDGTPCNRTNKLIIANTNRNSVVRNTLSPRVEARYVRISAQYWKGWPCLRTELLGCPADEVSPTQATPLMPSSSYCIVPKDEKCQVADGTKIMFKSGKECTKDYMEFKLDADGFLWHVCSNKKICPENGATYSGVRLTISSGCKDEDSKFIRTSGFSLKHVKSGKCVHPNGGRPGNNRELVLWSGCDEERLNIFFIKPDCLLLLGMSNNKINDRQITASSTRNKDLPHYARLHNNKYWCAAEKKKGEYLQIDLGEIRTISYVLMQGRGNWYDWITGYHLLYSSDGQRWTGYTESGDAVHSNSYCYQGKCSETHATQCQDLWGADANNGNKGCYDKLNTEAKGYGTCTPFSDTACAAKDVSCGQIQCYSNKQKPLVNYGKSYSQIVLDDSNKCSAAILEKAGDSVGLGMVQEGTKCGDKKMCVNYKCQSFDELNIKRCPVVNNKECNGRGACTSTGECQCYQFHDPKSGCSKALSPQDGGFSSWSDWSICPVGCGGGKQFRHRFCNNPTPKNGGNNCEGKLEDEQDCNTIACPKGYSCRHLLHIANTANLNLPDGVYDIYPRGPSSDPVKTFCDMSRDGGGWTLLVTSHTNSWTKDNVQLRNADKPSLTSDYSILKYADDINSDIAVAGLKFEYRLEAQRPGRWGGIWEADRSFTFTSTNNQQTNVKLIKKFDNWNYHNNGIEKRMPWISGARLTTSSSARSSWWGTITGDDKSYHPAPWISGHLMEKQPEYIWYWMREGPFEPPRSCLDAQLRGLTGTPIKDGIYTIKPPGHQPVDTYCDFTTNGGGWTLLLTSKTHSGWTSENVKRRNADQPSLDKDFSILDIADSIKDFDISQDFFQYRVEANGKKKYGGIFDAPKDYTFTSTCDKQTNVKLVETFFDSSSISKSTNLAKRMPRLGLSSSIFLSSGSTSDDASGTIVYNDGSGDQPTYIPSKPTPQVVRYWMREGTRRSCFDIKLHAERQSLSLKDYYYMIRLINDSTYMPVFCDMTSDPGAYTLLVTSRHGSWSRDQVPLRNMNIPSLHNDYSILKYADLIKKLSNNATFKYKLDANGRGHWGGVFSAPKSYSFMSTSNTQTNVKLIKKFDKWDFSWWKGLNKRMPWFVASGNPKKALLTTSTSSTYYPSGSIIYGDSSYKPAYWMRYSGMENPGVIWYWVNEDDCSPDRKPVNGGLSKWSDWSKCDRFCSPGKKRRTKACTNPLPRCGGKLCNAAVAQTLDENDCNVCPESPIRSNYGAKFCVQPQSGDCNPADRTPLVFKNDDGTGCAEKHMKFLFGEDGVIYHKCSMKIVCSESGNNIYRGSKLLLVDSCPDGSKKHKRIKDKNGFNLLQNLKNSYCVHPSGGRPSDGTKLVYWRGCEGQRLSLDFFNLPAA